MSKLKELIDRLCPNGVPHVKFGDALEFRRGQTITEKDSTPGEYPVIAGGQKPAYYHNEYNRSGETIAVAGSGAYAGFVSWWTTPIFLSDAFSVHPKSDNLLPKYVYYYMVNMQQQIHNTKKGSGVPHVHGSSIAKFVIPVPPIEVQEEIVKILDRFADYAAELQAELQARKEQYEYYRNLLLTFNPSACGCGTDGEQEIKVTTWGGHSYEITWKTMGEVLEMKAGKSIPSSSIVNINSGGMYACFGANGLRGYVNKANNQTDNVLIGRQGALCGNICFANGPYYATDHAVVVGDSPLFNKRFLFHLLVNANLNQYKTAGAQPGLSVEILKKVIIPVPPIELQEKIVAILDRFETLVNDLTQGLPAEIAAVKEQYEYYRNRLLTFRRRDMPSAC